MNLHLAPEQIEAMRRLPAGLNRVKWALDKLEATQDALASASGFSKQHISLIVNSLYRRVALDTARRLAEAFGVTVDDLFPADRRTGKDRRKKSNDRPRKTEHRTGSDRREKAELAA
jgi:transcriptional regulator with XRE-family HTH domain